MAAQDSLVLPSLQGISILQEVLSCKAIGATVSDHLNPAALKAPLSKLVLDIRDYLRADKDFDSNTTSINTLPNEILEQILLRLPMKDLLLSQRVCSRWRAMIQTSSRLQTALFLKPPKSFEPFSDPEVVPLLQQGNISLAALTLIAKNSPPGTPSWMLKADWASVVAGGYGKTVKNPLLDSKFEEYMPITCLQSESIIYTIIYVEQLEDNATTTLPPSFLYPEASWRKMHITRDPCIAGYFGVPVREGSERIDRFITKFDGIRLGDLISDASLVQSGLVPQTDMPTPKC